MLCKVGSLSVVCVTIMFYHDVVDVNYGWCGHIWTYGLYMYCCGCAMCVVCFVVIQLGMVDVCA